MKHLAALAAMVWCVNAPAAEPPQAPPIEPGMVIWVPVMVPANISAPFFVPPPLIWMLQALPPSIQAGLTPLVPPAPAEPRVEVASTQEPPPLVAMPAPVVQAEPPVPAPDAAVASGGAAAAPAAKPAAKAPTAKPAPAKKSPAKSAKPAAPAKPKPRKMCWKDNVIAPCP
jgi:hypothetical protein